MANLNLAATLNKNGSITTTWSRVSGGVRYQLGIHTPGNDFMWYNEQNLPGTSFTTDPSLGSGKWYWIQLYVYTGTDHKVWTYSEVVKIFIPYDFYDNVPMTVPQNIKAAADTVSVSVSFDPVAHARSYDILFDGTVYNVTTTQKKFAGLKPKTSHTYAVRAKSTNQTGAYSPTKSIMTLQVSPAIPTNIKKTVTENSATISWGAVSGATGYDLLFNGTTYSLTATSKTFTGLTSGKGYTFQIRAKNTDASSAYTNVMTVTTAPKPPASVTAICDEDSVTVSWTAATGATGYIIRFKGIEYHAIGTSNKFTGLTPNTSYTYQVCSKSPDGVGSYSREKAIRTAPKPPETPTVSAAKNSLTISWNPVPGATGYDVLVDGTVYHTTDTTKTITGLTPGTEYTYQIRANNADGSSSYTDSQTVTTIPNPPGVPTNVQVSATPDSVTISWDAVPGAASYDVTFDGRRENVTETTKTYTGLTPNKNYAYSVRANNAGGSSAYTDSQLATTPVKSPDVPTGVGATATKNSVTLRWDAIAGASSYDVLFNGTVYNVSGTSKTITGLTPGMEYSYQVRANNAGGSGPYSTPLTVSTIPNAPTVPTNVNATATVNSVTVSWNAVAGAESYIVLFNGKAHTVYTTSKTFTGLTSGASYTYEVCAKNISGTSAYSAVKTIKTVLTPPAMPANVKAIPKSREITLVWDITNGASSYDIMFNGKLSEGVKANVRTYVYLAPDTSYTYKVRAKNAAGVSAYSPLQSARTLPAPPSVPTNVSATATTNSVTVSWSAVSGASGYNLRFNGAVINVTGTSRTITELESGTDCTYQVCANNAGGSSAYSAEKTIQTAPVIPDVPAGISADPEAVSVLLGWNMVRGALSYDVIFNGITYNDIVDTSMTISGLSSNADYIYQLRAKNAAGCSEYSAESVVRTLLDVPDNIQSTAAINSVLVSFRSVDGAAGYDIKFNGSIYHITDTFIEFGGLIPETDYTYSIRAVNEVNYSMYSPYYSVRTRMDVPPVPSDVNAVSTLNSVIVRFSPVPKATDYDIAFDGEIYHVTPSADRIPSAGTFSLLTDRESNTSCIVRLFTGLAPNTSHTYCARANNESGSSEFSPLMAITTKISKYSGLPDAGWNRTYPDGRFPHMGLDPVNALNGAFLWSYTWLLDYGKDSLHFTIMYDSQRDEYSNTLGRGWTCSFNYLLYMDNEYAYFSTPYDEVIPFCIDKQNDSFQLAEGIQSGYTLEKKGNQSYLIRNIDGMEYVFDSNLRLSRMAENGMDILRFIMATEGQILIKGRYGASLTMIYEEGHISRVTNNMGDAVTFLYENDYLICAANSDAGGTLFTYDDSGKLFTITDFSGKNYLANQYDSEGRVIAQNTAGRGEAYVSYDEENRVTTFTDEAGNETNYYYDDRKRITEVSCGNLEIRNKYDESGRLTEQTDGLGNVTVMGYDKYGRMNCVTYPDGTKEQILYNDKNDPIRITNRDETESLYSYDEQRHLIAAQDERGNTASYTYDNEENLTVYTDKNGNQWTYAYDSENHLTQASDPEGNTYRYSHDAAGRLLSYTTPAGKETAYYYSPIGDLLRIADADGNLVFDYDENGNNTAVTDRIGNKKYLEYDEMGKITSATDFLGNKHIFTYDERGNLLKETDPKGYVQSYEYNARGNCTTWTDKNGNATSYTFNAADQITQVHDAAGGIIRYVYDTMGQVTVVTDPLNHQAEYTYDSMGRILSVTNALGHSVSYTYDACGNLLTKTDEDEAATLYTYDAESRLTGIQSDAGTTLFTYDSLGRVTAVQDACGYTETMQYDGDGNVTAHLNKENGRTTYTYNASGRIAEEMNPEGGKTTYDYDQNGNCVKITDAEGNEYRYEYDPNGRLTKIVDPLGNDTTYEYDAVGNLIAVTDPKGGETSREYDGNGNLIKETNPAGGTRAYVYDCLNRLIEVTDEEGYKQTYAYDAAGNKTSYTDANGNRWEYRYDAINRLISVVNKEDNQLQFDYTKTGRIAKVTDEEGAETTYTYDSLGRLLEMKDALNNRLSFTYDSLGRLLTQTDANGNTTEYEYSPSGRLLSVKMPSGDVTAYTYNALGLMVTETDALGGVTSYEYDVLGRTTAVTDALGGKNSFTYTSRGEIATVTDANGAATHYEYDACGNLLKLTDPLGNTVLYEYDAANNQIKECLETSEEPACVTLWQYDKKGRMIREITPMTGEKSYTYDGNGNIVLIQDEDQNKTAVRYDLNSRPVRMNYSDGKTALFRYNKRGELIEITDWNGTTIMEYGRIGRLSKVTDHNGRATGYAYDANGNITNIVYPDGSAAGYAYDKNNRLIKVTDAEGEITQYTYDKKGNILSLVQPGSTSAYTYNAKGLPTKVRYSLNDGNVMENSFTYDAVGNIVGSERNGNTAELTASAAYTYDPLGRLLSCREGQNTQAYGYDALGNRLFKKVNNVQTAAYQYNEGNQLTAKMENGISFTYGYDRRGNLTEERRNGVLTGQYTYDATNHMVLGRNPETRETTEYGYNALYMRIKNVQIRENLPDSCRSHTGQLENSRIPFITRETEYVPDYLSAANNELMSYEKDFGTTRTTYGRGYERLSQKIMLQSDAPATPRMTIAGNTIGKSFLQSDILGSPLFAADGQGNTLRYAQRNIWGDLKIPVQEDLNSAGIENSLLFANYRYDPVIAKYFAQERFYDSGQGRMLGKDPIKRGLNGYPYCDNNPVNYVDPTGEIANILISGLVGGAVGGVFGFAGSALSQAINHEKFDVKKALGSAANGAVVGAVRGALVGSGVGAAASLAANFAGGVGGSILDQGISKGSVSLKDSIVGGLTNAVSGAIYTNNPLKNAGQALWRGAASGGVAAGINYLAHAWDNQDTLQDDSVGSSGTRTGWIVQYPYMSRRDPKSRCGVPDPFGSKIGYRTSYGYQYEENHDYMSGKGGKRSERRGPSFAEFGKNVLLGGVLGGLSSVMFYQADKAFKGLKGSIRSTRGNKGGSFPHSEPLSLEEALIKLEKSSLKPGQTEISRSRVMQIVDSYDPIKASSSVYTDSTGRYLVEGHHTTVANTILGKGSGLNMNTPTNQQPSAKNISWSKNWYEFWKTSIKVGD